MAPKGLWPPREARLAQVDAVHHRFEAALGACLAGLMGVLVCVLYCAATMPK